MRIIFDIHTLPGTYLSASGSFLTDLVEEMAEKFSQHSFIYLEPRRSPKSGNLSHNVTIHHTKSILSKWFGKKFWYKYILPKELKKLKGDLYITVDTLFLGRTVMPVCLFLFHATETLAGARAEKNRLEKKRTISSFQKSDLLIAFSESERLMIDNQSPRPGANVKIIPPYLVENTELKWTEKEMVKIDFAGGVEYFVFAGDLHERHDLIGLLKAFALFKKWQQSNMRLIIAGSKTDWTEKFRNEFASFKYRNEVNLMLDPSKEKLQKVIAGAYAFVYPAIYDNFPVNILKAVQAGVPVISSPLPVCKEWCGDTIMYPETNDAAGFATSMQLMYKDERLRSGFVDSAKKRLSENEKYDTAESCMIFFEETIAK